MNEVHVTELNIVSFFFAMALFFFLRVLNRRDMRIRYTFVRMLFAGTLVALAEALLGTMLNAGLTREIPYALSMLSFFVMDVTEVVECIFFVWYIVDHAKETDEIRKKCLRPLRGLLAIYLAVQVVNLFTGIVFFTTPDGRLIAGPLLIPVVYLLPGVLLLYGTVLYFLIVQKESASHRISVLSAVLLPLIAAFIQLQITPQLMMIGFFVVLSDFLIYFSLETPAFKQLNVRMQELEEAGKEAEEAKRRALDEDEAMNDFLSNMSHEIRTPLTAILGYDEVIIKDAPEEDVRAYAEDIRAAGNTLLYIVNDILDFSKMASGNMTLSVGAYHLSEVLDNIGNIIRKRANDKGLEYRTRIDDTIPDMLYGDGVRVNQIMINLLNNAVKYTSHGYVQLSVAATRGTDERFLTLKVAVEDTGIGIKEEEMGKLFDAFARFDRIKNNRVEGTGLGLAITSQLLQMMGGTIDVDSVYGKGSIFSVSIPQQVAGSKTIAQRAAQGLRADDQTEETFYAPEAQLLVVDDNETNRTVVGELLRHTLVEIDTASSGMEALAMVRGNAYDLILLDQMMPNMSGPETLKQMRALSDNASEHAQVIAFTANAVAGVKEQLLAQGFDDYLAKPVTGQDLIKMMIRHLPREKYLLPGDAGYDEAAARDKSLHGESEKSDDQILLESLQGIDLSLALTYCGTKEVLRAAVTDFYLTIPQQSDLIERYLGEGDIANYTIKVHALKSAARFIGAEKLSDEAAQLEQLGIEGREEEIRERTPEMLALYRSYLEKLNAVAPANKTRGEEISADDLAEAYEELRSFALAFDFDGIDAVMGELSSYDIPEEEAERFEKIRDAVANVNREALLELL